MKKPIAGWLVSFIFATLVLPVFAITAPNVALATESIDTPRKNFLIGTGGDSPFGANVQGAARYRELGRATVPFDRSQELGIGWNREELRWDLVEPNPGRFDWQRTDIAIDESLKRGIQIIGLLCYNVTNVNGVNQSNPNMPDIGAWRNYVSQVVRRYSSKVKHWEIWNEPENRTYFTGTPEQYAQLLSNAYDVIKGIDASAQVITAGVDPSAIEKFLPEVLNAGGRGKYDILGVHPYLNQATSPDKRHWAEEAVGSFKAFSQRNGAKPVWATEFGWNTIGNQIAGRTEPQFAPIGESEQADYIARSYVQGLAAGLDKMVVYEMRDDPNDRQSGYGLTRNTADYQPKPSFNVVKTLISRLRGTTFRERFDVYSDSRNYFQGFEDDNFGSFTGNAPGSSVNLSNVQKRSGSRSAEVNFAIPSSGAVVVGLRNELRFNGEPSKIGFFAYGDNSGARLRVVARDNAGKTLFYPVGRVGGGTWSRYEAFLPGEYEQPGVGFVPSNIQYPITFIGVEVYTIFEETVRGKVFIDDIYFNFGTQAQGYRFQKGDGSHVDVVWATEGGDTIAIASNSASAKVFNRDGGQQGDWGASNGSVRGQIGGQMLFVEHNGKDFAPVAGPGGNSSGGGSGAITPPTPGTGCSNNGSATENRNFIDNAFRDLWLKFGDNAPFGTYIWGPNPIAAGTEPYLEANGGQRRVLYFDKSRMELTKNDGFVTNGLLTVELVSGNLQLGDNAFCKKNAADVPVAGDQDDTNGPRYRSLNARLNDAPKSLNVVISDAIDVNGNVRQDNSFARYNIVGSVTVPETNHTIAKPFNDFLNEQARKYNASYVFEVSGLPITEAYWAKVKVAGEVKDVLIQAFERRVLTYTPSNATSNQVEWGNIGRHYLFWRHNFIPQ
jgi:hypothetical protein